MNEQAVILAILLLIGWSFFYGVLPILLNRFGIVDFEINCEPNQE